MPLHESPANASNVAIFEVLPNELIGEVLSHISHVELIFNTSHVCKYWRSICGEYILQAYEKMGLTGKREVDPNQFLTSARGRKFIKYLLRKEVFEFACKLARNSAKTVETRSCSVMERWADEELTALKGYFNRFTDLGELPHYSLPVRKPETINQGEPPQPSGFFGNTLSFLGSLFSTSDNSSVVNKTVTTEPPKPEYDYLTKVLLEGDSASGKTSLLNCAMNDTPVNPSMANYCTSTIGVDFSVKNFQIGETSKIKLQLWDQCGPERFKTITQTYYKHCSVILLLMDPSSQYSTLGSMDQKLILIKERAPKVELLLITTKKDLNNERLISNETADKYAFDNFGGLHLDITNTIIDEPTSIIWYCAILKYLLAPNANTI